MSCWTKTAMPLLCDNHVYRHENGAFVCGGCGQAAPKQDGYTSLVNGPGDGIHFEKENFHLLFQHEDNHFWFRSRNRIIAWAAKRYFSRATSFFELGCGTGYVLGEIGRSFPGMRLYGGDVHPEALPYAARRAPKASFFLIDGRTLPFENEFDVIGAFDVIEHIEDDERVLRQMHDAARPGGGVILTVPQHPFLWSRFDVFAGHRRRYTSGELKDKLERAGFQVVLVRSFVSLLFPALLLNRSRSRSGELRGDEGLTGLRIGKAANAAAEAALSFERFLISLGVAFPFGGSLLAVAVKKT